MFVKSVMYVSCVAQNITQIIVWYEKLLICKKNYMLGGKFPKWLDVNTFKQKDICANLTK